MTKRFLAIWFPHLLADWLAIRRPEFKDVPFVFARPEHGRLLVTAMNAAVLAQGIETGMRTADAKAIVPGLEVFDDKPERPAELLRGLGEWCIRYTPIIATDLPDGLILNISGCAHLWGGEEIYLKEITSRLKSKGYHARAAIADTVGAAWAICRFGQAGLIISPGGQMTALLPLPPAALRLEPEVLERLHKLGFYRIEKFIGIQRSNLRRRFGESLLLRLSQAIGETEEAIQPLHLIEPYQERLPCLEAIRTKTGIEIAITKLLEALCKRLADEGKGIRTAVLKCYRVDGKTVQVAIGTNKGSHSPTHLFKLFELKIGMIEPALGIELFVLEAPKVEDVEPSQEALWAKSPGLDGQGISELIDRIAGKVGAESIHRYLPDEHYWPERSLKLETSLHSEMAVTWLNPRPRPTQLLPQPEPIEVAAPIPDYPPILFNYRGSTHYIKKADGPERIGQEWWLQQGEHRDYYTVEDMDGQRYWLFRLGHYQGDQSHKWFIHGFFA